MGEETAQPSRQWDGVLRRSLDITTRAINEVTRSVTVLASTASIDSHGDIVEQDWVLDRYKKNPVVLWQHNRFETGFLGGSVRPEDLLPIGRAENVSIGKDGLEATIVFASADLSSLGDKIFRMFQERMLNAVSVGFRPGKVIDELQPNGKTIYRLSQNELCEISAVTLPSNPDAVAKTFALEREQLARLVINKTVSEETATMTPEEKATLDVAVAEAKSLGSRVAALETELTREKAAAAQFEKAATEAAARALKAEELIVETEIDKLVGKKLYPAQREEYLKLAKELGIERVKTICATHQDIKILESVKSGGHHLRSGIQPSPESIEDGGDASSDIVAAAEKAAERAA